MKKFGTPIGAGPGSAYEYVGFEGVGTPFGVTGGGGVVGFLVFFGVLFFDFFCFCFPFSTFEEPRESAFPGVTDVFFVVFDPADVVVVVVVVVVEVEVGFRFGFGFGFGFGVVEVGVEVEVEVEVV